MNLVPTSVTLNNREWRNNPYFALFHRIRYIRRPITSQWLKTDLLGSVKNILFMLYFVQNWPTQQSRGLFAIAKLFIENTCRYKRQTQSSSHTPVFKTSQRISCKASLPRQISSSSFSNSITACRFTGFLTSLLSRGRGLGRWLFFFVFLWNSVIYCRTIQLTLD